MQAGQLVARAIKNKLKSWSQQSVKNWLATFVGSYAANQIVKKATTVGVGALATYLGTHVAWLGSLAGPLGIGIAGAIGWL